MPSPLRRLFWTFAAGKQFQQYAVAFFDRAVANCFAEQSVTTARALSVKTKRLSRSIPHERIESESRPILFHALNSQLGETISQAE